ncbi:MAG: glycosyltransferase family 4 protein [Deltaproteobacteria bacterium]|nr:glycosyltransferase family 4 protein [Deltaproteobacteria bacterium]
MIQDPTSTLTDLVELIAQHRTVLLFLSCTALGALGAWLIAGIAFREHLLDVPNERSSHSVPTPRGGGVGILAAFILAGLTLRIPTTFLFAGILVSAVSLYGDYLRISVGFRLLFQILAALMTLFPLLPRLSIQYRSVVGSDPLIFLLILMGIFVFMIGTANFFNFMDGINGIAGLSGAIAFGFMGVYALNRGPQDAFQVPLSLLAVCISLACLGYLPFNLPRAKVFMGDVGSILLGFIFACLVVTLSRDYLEMVCLAGLLFPFYADELTTMAVRLRDRENLTQSHRRHLYQLLANQFGVAHWKVTLLYGAVQVVVGALVLIAYPYGLWSVLIFLTVCLAGFTGLASHVRNRVNLQPS